MSTVVYVEPEDDVRSVRAKLERIEESSVGLLLPESSRAFASAVSLRLLGRQAESLGIELFLITSDPAVQRLAAAEGLRVFPTLPDYERANRPEPEEAAPEGSGRRDGAQQGIPALASAAAVLLLLVLLVAVVVVFVPHATVIVYPQTEALSGKVEVLADPNQQTIDIERRRIPARYVLLLVQATDQLMPGEGQPPSDGRASGIVTFTNRAPDAQVVPKGSAVSTPEGIRFLTDAEVIVPAGVGRTISVKVVAEVAGDQGNVARLRIAAVQGVLDRSLYVQNREPTAGGGIPGVPIVTAVDRDYLLNRVADRARTEALSEALKSLAKGELLVGESLQLRQLEVTYDGEIGQEVSALGIFYRAEASCVVVGSEALDRVSLQTWRPTALPGYEVVESTIRAKPPEVVAVEEQVVTLRVQLIATARAIVDTAQIGQLARWRTADEVRRLLLRAYSLARTPEVQYSPTWAERAYRVQVLLVTGDATTPPAKAQ